MSIHEDDLDVLLELAAEAIDAADDSGPQPFSRSKPDGGSEGKKRCMPLPPTTQPAKRTKPQAASSPAAAGGASPAIEWSRVLCLSMLAMS